MLGSCGTYREPEPRSTLPASAVCASFPMLRSARSGRLQPGPLRQGRARGQHRLAAPGACPAAPSGEGKGSAGGNQKLRDSHSASSRPEIRELNEPYGVNKWGQAGVAQGPPPLHPEQDALGSWEQDGS